MDETRINAANSLIRSLVSASDYGSYEETGQFNTGSGTLNRGVLHLLEHGYLTDFQHRKLKTILTSGSRNRRFEDDPEARQYGNLFVLDGGKR